MGYISCYRYVRIISGYEIFIASFVDITDQKNMYSNYYEKNKITHTLTPMREGGNGLKKTKRRNNKRRIRRTRKH